MGIYPRLVLPLASLLAAGSLAATDSDSLATQSDLTVEGHDGWLFFGRELEHLSAGKFWGERAVEVSAATRPEWADPLPAILDFHRQLQEREILLLVVPVPAKASIYPDLLPGDKAAGIETSHEAHREFYALLRENGVEVIDLFDAFSDWVREGGDNLYCQTDTHWSGHGVVLAGQQIRERLADLALLEAGSGLSLGKEWEDRSISGDLAGKRGITEVVPVRRVGREGDFSAVDPSDESPVLLLGDSHNLIFHDGGDLHGRQAGLADQLAYELGVPVDLVAVRGSGATPARINLFRRAQRNPAYWDEKKIVIWCFSVREFTQADGWRVVPISR